jgi:hypothetical protein
VVGPIALTVVVIGVAVLLERRCSLAYSCLFDGSECLAVVMRAQSIDTRLRLATGLRPSLATSASTAGLSLGLPGCDIDRVATALVNSSRGVGSRRRRSRSASGDLGGIDVDDTGVSAISFERCGIVSSLTFALYGRLASSLHHPARRLSLSRILALTGRLIARHLAHGLWRPATLFDARLSTPVLDRWRYGWRLCSTSVQTQAVR